jgi:hypothetical protein
MTPLDDVVRPRWPTRGTEDHVLWTFLDFERATLAKKCAGLTPEQLATKSMPPSNLSLLGLLRHAVDHEIFWYEQIFLGRDTPSAYGSDSDSDFDFNGLDSASVETVVEQWLRQCEISRSIVAGRSLDDACAVTPDFLEAPVPLRLLAVHGIEEYARHCGHADLLRQGIDGAEGY